MRLLCVAHRACWTCIVERMICQRYWVLHVAVVYEEMTYLRFAVHCILSMLSAYCRAYYTLKILRVARCTICSGSTMLNAMDCPLYSRAHSSPPKVFTESNVTSNRRRPDVTKKQYVVLILVPAFVCPHIRVISVIRSDWFLYVLKRSFALAPNIFF